MQRGIKIEKGVYRSDIDSEGEASGMSSSESSESGDIKSVSIMQTL